MRKIIVENLEPESRGTAKVHVVLPMREYAPTLTDLEVVLQIEQNDVLAIQKGLGFEKDAIALLKDVCFEEIVMNIKMGPNNVSSTYR